MQPFLRLDLYGRARFDSAHTTREARSEHIRSPSCCRCHDDVGLDGGRDDRDTGGELGRLRGRRVVGPDG